MGRVRKAQLAPPARRAAGGRRSHRAVCGALRPLRPRDLLTRRVQLVRRDGRDVSTLYGRGGGVPPPAGYTNHPRGACMWTVAVPGTRRCKTAPSCKVAQSPRQIAMQSQGAGGGGRAAGHRTRCNPSKTSTSVARRSASAPPVARPSGAARRAVSARARTPRNFTNARNFTCHGS